jgi:ribose/xylose/arabinose/galactoside ABC-type transport system permease subunit
LDAIATAVVGGTSLMGGEGTIIGKLFGALLIGILNNDMNLLNVNPYFQMVIKGVVIFGAVYLSILTRKNNR